MLVLSALLLSVTKLPNNSYEREDGLYSFKEDVLMIC